MSEVSAEDLEALIQIFRESTWDQIDLIVGDWELHLSKAEASVRLTRRTAGQLPSPALADVSAAIEPTVADLEKCKAAAIAVEIRAPHVCTFHRSSTPVGSPYIEIGDAIDAESEMGQIQVMGNFKTLQAGVKGIVREICVDDATLVDAGQVLFIVETAE